jgi:hypothetical protein
MVVSGKRQGEGEREREERKVGEGGCRPLYIGVNLTHRAVVPATRDGGGGGGGHGKRGLQQAAVREVQLGTRNVGMRGQTVDAWDPIRWAYN